MTGTRFSRLGFGFALLALTASLAACGSQTPVEQEPSTAPPVAESTPTPTATPSPEPAAASCESLLDLSTLEAILTTGYDVNPAPDYLAKIRAEGSPYALFDDYDGLVCPVNNGSRVTELYGYSPITAADQATQEARLVSEGWTASTVDAGTLYELTEPQEGIVFAFYFRNGFWWCGYDAGVIRMIVANSPES